jgi:peptidyl-prolyl cis-trans isomerase D
VLNVMRAGAQNKVVKTVLFGFLLMATGGLALGSGSSLFRNGLHANNAVVTIAGEKMSPVAFDNIVRRTLSRQSMDTDTAWQLGLIDQILNNEISNNLLTLAAKDNGIYIGDDVIVGQIKQIVAPYVSSTVTAQQALKSILMSQGMSEQQLVGALRQEMTNNIMRSAVVMAANVSVDAEANDLYQYTFENRAVRALLLPNDKVEGVQEATDEVLLPFYQAGQERYAIPETRSFTLAVLSPDAVKNTLEITDEDLQAMYDEQVDSFTTAEKRNLEQAILTDQAQAEAVVTRLGKGESMKDAIKAETGSTDAYLGTAGFEEKGLTKEIAEKAFSADKGAVIGPVQSALGYHVLVVKDTVPVHTRSFDEVKKELRDEALHDKLADQMYALSGQIDDHIAGGGTLDDLVDEMKLKMEKFGPLRADGSTAESKDGFKEHADDRNAILQTAFEIAEGDTSPVMELADGSFAAVRVEKVTPKTYKPFDEVKGELAKVWIKDQREVLNKQKAQDILNKLQSGETDLDKAAKEAGLSVRAVDVVRGKDTPAPLTEAAKTAVFATRKGQFAMAPGMGGYAVFTVTDVNVPDVSKAAKEDIEKVRANATQGMQQEIFTMYLENLRKKYGVKVNRHQLEQMYGPGAEDASM